MKFVLAVILTALFAFISGLFFPWWSIAIIAFLVALLIRQSPGRSFLAGFIALFILWSLIAFWIDVKNESILSRKVAQLFSLGQSSLALIFVTGLIGALVAGFGAMSGAFFYPKAKHSKNGRQEISVAGRGNKI